MLTVLIDRHRITPTPVGTTPWLEQNSSRSDELPPRPRGRCKLSICATAATRITPVPAGTTVLRIGRTVPRQNYPTPWGRRLSIVSIRFRRITPAPTGTKDGMSAKSLKNELPHARGDDTINTNCVAAMSRITPTPVGTTVLRQLPDHLQTNYPRARGDDDTC